MSNVSATDNLMYECGLEVLHPGGWEKTDEMARACGVGSHTKVLDIGGGRGTTDAAAITNGSVSVDLTQSTVDAQSLGLKGVEAKGDVTGGLQASSDQSVADILGRLRSESAPEPRNKIHGIASLEELPDDLSLEMARVEAAMLEAACRRAGHTPIAAIPRLVW